MRLFPEMVPSTTQSWRTAIERNLPALGLLIAASWVCDNAIGAAGGCDDGLFGIVAQVIRIDPVETNKRAFRLLQDGQEVDISVNNLICTGESVVVRQGGPIVELYSGGRKIVAKPGEPFHNNGGAVRHSKDALAFLLGLLEFVEGRSVPDPPRPTHSRGRHPSENSVALQISTIGPLDDLPAQLVTLDVDPVVAWREGVGPYACQAVTELGDMVFEIPRPDSASWCEFKGNLKSVVQLIVREAAGPSTSWSVARVEWKDVPRPRWIRNDVGSISPADRTAWAVWLWTKADDRWRLQSLGMLNELASEVWLAGYARDRILAGKDLGHNREKKVEQD